MGHGNKEPAHLIRNFHFKAKKLMNSNQNSTFFKLKFSWWLSLRFGTHFHLKQTLDFNAHNRRHVINTGAKFQRIIYCIHLKKELLCNYIGPLSLLIFHTFKCRFFQTFIFIFGNIICWLTFKFRIPDSSGCTLKILR